MNVKEIIQAVIDGKTLIGHGGGELTFDPTFRQPFRFRMRNCYGDLCEGTHPIRGFVYGEWTIPPPREDPADWMEKPEYARAKFWMERCEAERVENDALRFRLDRLEALMSAKKEGR